MQGVRGAHGVAKSARRALDVTVFVDLTTRTQRNTEADKGREQRDGGENVGCRHACF